MFSHLRWRIGVPYVILIVLVMAGLWAYLTTTLRARELGALEDGLRREALLVADDASARLNDGASPAEMDALAKALGKSIGTRVTIIARDGTVLGDSDADPKTMENHGTRPEVLQALQEGQGESERHSATLDEDLLYVAVVMRRGSDVIGFARVALPVRDVDRLLDRITLVVGVASAAAGAIAAFLAALIARRTTEPISRLTAMARRMSKGDLAHVIALDRPDELGQLAVAFNEMAAELRRKVRAIENQSAELEAILASMADGVILVDDAGRVVGLNRAAEELLEVSDEAARGKSLATVARRHELVALLDRPDAREVPLIVEIGTDHRQAQVVVTRFRGGQLPGRVIVLQDVTLLRRAEAMRRDFVANVSHELRTPLASLRALVETLEDGALDDPPAAREFLDRMHHEVDGLGQMVEELLELARIESGRVRLQVGRTDLVDLAREVRDRLAPQAERNGVDLQLEPHDGPIEALVDRERFRQVLVNLVHNAIKFTPSGGSVRVWVEPRGKAVALVVADTGAGIPPEDLPRIFERFYKADRSRSTPGTGLGLAIVKHLVQIHGGQVWAESAGPGKGASFTVVVPA